MNKLLFIAVVFSFICLGLVLPSCGGGGSAATNTNAAMSKPVNPHTNAKGEATNAVLYRAYVLSKTGINIRKSPDINADRVAQAPFRTWVNVLFDDKEPVAFEYEGIKARWVLVEAGGKIGYAFGGYLTKLPVPTIGSTFEEYFTKSFGKEGALKLEGGGLSITTNIVTKQSNLTQTNYLTNKAALQTKTQGYKMGASLAYEGRITRASLPVSSLSEAFLIARLCGVVTFGVEKFPLASSDTNAAVKVALNPDSLEIKKSEGEFVFIKRLGAEMFEVSYTTVQREAKPEKVEPKKKSKKDKE